MGKINTNTLLLIGAAAVGVYLLTRPKTMPVGYNPYMTPGYNPYGTTAYNPTGLPAAGSNQTAQIISAGGSALEGLSSLLGNFF
jgi:hypothetical protein